MRWNIIVECVGEYGKQSTITLGTIERLAGSTTAENLGVNLQESKRIANRLQDTVVKRQLEEHSRSSGARMAMPKSTFRRCYSKGDETLRPSCVLSPMVRTA